MSAHSLDDLSRAIRDTVRNASADKRLITADEVAETLRRLGFGDLLEPSPQVDARHRVAAMLSGLPGVESLASVSGGVAYHDTTVLSRAYARILDRKIAPAVMLAEEVRSNCRDYPRPVSVELFEKPPFDLAPQALRAALETLESDPKFQDIASLTTSEGAAYLFSTLHMRRAHALFLAERDASFALDP